MNIRLFFTVFFFLLFGNMISCKKPQAQLPSNKSVHKDIPSLDLARVNKEMIQREDSALTAFVKTRNLSLEKTDAGFWYKINKTTNEPQLRKDDICVLTYRLYSLDGKLLEEIVSKEIVIGKKDVITGLDDALPLMRAGEEATFLFPWNLAYGMKGYKQLVPPYTSVLFEVAVD